MPFPYRRAIGGSTRDVEAPIIAKIVVTYQDLSRILVYNFNTRI